MGGLRLATLTLVIAAVGCATAPAAPHSDAKWFGIYLESGQRIGASGASLTPWEGGQRAVETFEMQFNEGDKHVVRTTEQITRYIDATGRTMRIERVSSNDRDSVTMTIEVHADEAIAVRKTADDQSTLRTPLSPGVRFDNGEGLLPEHDFSAGDLSFDNFNVSSLLIERIVMHLKSADAATGERQIARTAYRNEALVSVSELTLNATGEIVETTLDVLGAHMVQRPISATEAAIPALPASFIANVMVKSPNRISSQAARGHIRYVFGFAGGRVFDLPQTADQTVARKGEDAVVDICEDCGPGLPTDPQFLAAGLRSTMWLQSGADKLRKMATFQPGDAVSDRQKMQLLGLRARRVMSKLDFTGHYSALEAAERHAGDCTEDAVLLAALARAAGIPAYVATGIVYSRERYHGVSNAFMPHNWVLAYVDGKWSSFDISLGDFDATHIALSINEGEAGQLASAQQLSSQLIWRGISEVRQSP